MNAPEDRIWQGIRAHLDALGSMSTVPPIGNILDRRRPRWSALSVAVLASAGAMALAVGLLLPGLLAVKPPLTGATPDSSSAPTSPHATPVDWSELIGQTYVAVDVDVAGQPVAIVPDTRLVLGFSDASRFGANAGCNGMGGDYQIQDGRLVTAGVHMTLKGCRGELGRQEGWYYIFLQSSPAISPNTTGLVLTGGDTVVTFVHQRYASPAPTQAFTWVAVIGPADFGPPEDLVLEVAGMAWYGSGGVVSVPTSGSTEVRLVGQETCHTYAEFVSESGAKTVIRFLKDGQVAIEDWTGRDIEAGPTPAHRAMSDCPRT